MNRKREKNESFDQYKKAMRTENELLKRRLKGLVIWPSRSFGTYTRDLENKQTRTPFKI